MCLVFFTISLNKAFTGSVNYVVTETGRSHCPADMSSVSFSNSRRRYVVCSNLDYGDMVTLTVADGTGYTHSSEQSTQTYIDTTPVLPMVSGVSSTIVENDVFFTISLNEAFTGSVNYVVTETGGSCLLYTSPSPRDRQKSRMPSSA